MVVIVSEHLNFGFLSSFRENESNGRWGGGLCFPFAEY